MKLLVAYIRPHKVDDVALALHQIPELTGMSVSPVRGWGHGKQEAEKRHHEDRVSSFDEYARLEVCCADSLCESVTDAIRSAAHTGLLGDGKILIGPVFDAIHIRTGERGEGAV